MEGETQVSEKHLGKRVIINDGFYQGMLGTIKEIDNENNTCLIEFDVLIAAQTIEFVHLTILL